MAFKLSESLLMHEIEKVLRGHASFIDQDVLENEALERFAH
jgi:hypothetical protein